MCHCQTYGGGFEDYQASPGVLGNLAYVWHFQTRKAKFRSISAVQVMMTIPTEFGWARIQLEWIDDQRERPLVITYGSDVSGCTFAGTLILLDEVIHYFAGQRSTAHSGQPKLDMRRTFFGYALVGQEPWAEACGLERCCTEFGGLTRVVTDVNGVRYMASSQRRYKAEQFDTVACSIRPRPTLLLQTGSDVRTLKSEAELLRHWGFPVELAHWGLSCRRQRGWSSLNRIRMATT